MPKARSTRPANRPSRRHEILEAAVDLLAVHDGVPGLLGGHHLSYWWSFVCQHQRPGTDIHADQSDVSINFWITPDTANLDPQTGGMIIYDKPPPDSWNFQDYNDDERQERIYAFLAEAGARIAPPVPAWYHQPSSIEEMVDFLVIRVFDCLGYDLGNLQRWTGPIQA